MSHFVLKLPPLWSSSIAKADQERFIHPPGGQRISVAATGTKTGKTMGCAIYCVEMAAKLPAGSLIWWVAPYWKTVMIGFERVKSLLPETRRKVNESEKTIVTSNGVRIEFRSAENPNTLFGEAVHCCIVDEGPRMRRAAWEAITTTMMQTQGPIRVAGNTDKGKNNWFYELYLRGVKGDPDVASWSIKTYENPHMNREYIMKQRASMTDRAWQALIEAEFVDDGSSVFRGIDECLYDPRPAQPDNMISLPYTPGLGYGFGTDLGKYTDFTVVTGLEFGAKKRLVYWDRFNQRSWPVQLQMIAMASQKYGNAMVVMDSTGAGEPVFEQAQRLGIPVQSYKLSAPAKIALIEKLIIGIEQRDILIPSNLFILREELASYEVEILESGAIRYSSPGEGRGVHDDAVISLALAYWNASVSFEVGYKSAQAHEMRMMDDEPAEPWIAELDNQWRDGRRILRDAPRVERGNSRWGGGGSRGSRWS